MCLSRDYSEHMIASGSRTSINSPVKQHSSHAEHVKHLMTNRVGETVDQPTQTLISSHVQ